MLKKLTISSVIAILGILSLGFLKAEASLGSIINNTTKSVTGKVSTVTNSAASTTNQTVNSVCGTITPKVDSKITDFNNKFDSHLTYFKNQREKLQLLVNQLNSKGLDTTKLRADLVLFDLKQQKFEDDKGPVLDKLGLIKTDKCANHMISAAGDLTSAIASEKTLMTDDKDILTFLDANIQQDISSLRGKSSN